MGRLLPSRAPIAGATDERMQRVRVGVTGLASIVLIVSLATAIAAGVNRKASEETLAAPPKVVATVNQQAEASEPLAQLGVAPDAKDAAETKPAR